MQKRAGLMTPIMRPIMRPIIRSIIGAQGGSFSPLSFFAANEQGVWLEAADKATLFQDSVGTTPVTAPGQPVGLILDKSKGLVLGSELVTAPASVSGAYTSPAAGTAIRNGTTGTAIVTNGVAGKTYRVTLTVSGQTGDSNFIRASDGSAVQINGNGDYTFTLLSVSSGGISINPWGGTAGTATFSNISVKELPGNHFTQPTAGKRPQYVRFPAGGTRNLLLNTATLSTQSVTVTAAAHTLHFTGTGTVTLSGTGSGSLVGTGASNRVSLTFTPTAGTLTLTVTGSVTAAQLELGSSVTGVQTVVSSADVTEAGVSDVWAVKGDGVDDFMSSAAIDFTGTDKMAIWAGVRKLDDTGRIVAELSSNIGANVGSFYVVAGADAGVTGYTSMAHGDAAAGAIQAAKSATFSGADTAALTITHDIAGDLSTIRRNGVAGTDGTGDKGTGNFGNYPLYLFSRAGTSLFFNGPMSSLIIRGAATDAAGITKGEKWTAERIGVTLP